MRDLAYDVKNLPVDGAPPGTRAEYIFVRCGKLDCNNVWKKVAAGRTVPEMVAKEIERSFDETKTYHWNFDLTNRARTRCPWCVKARKADAAGESGRKEVVMLGQSVSVSRELVPAPRHAVATTPVTEEKQINEYIVRIRTTRGMGSVAAALDDVGEIAMIKRWEPSAIPEHAAPSSPMALPIEPVHVEGPTKATAQELATPPVDAAPTERKRRKFNYSAESMANKIAGTKAHHARLRAAILDFVQTAYLENDRVTEVKLCAMLNKAKLRGPGRMPNDGWRLGMVQPYLDTLQITLRGGVVPFRSKHGRAPHTREEIRAAAMGDD